MFSVFSKISSIQIPLSTRLDCVSSPSRLAFFFRSQFSGDYVLFSGSHTLFTGPKNFFFNKTFIKNGSHGTIHIFKNYFTIMFSIFSKINGIQTDPKDAFGFSLKSQLILLFSLFLLLFTGPTTLFDTIHGSHCIISANFYFYLLYFQQNFFNFSQINKSQTDPLSDEASIGLEGAKRGKIRAFFFFFFCVDGTICD